MAEEFDVNEFMRRLETVLDERRRRLRAALYAEGEAIMADSKENYVPIDEGTLKASGHVVLSSGDAIEVTLAYGGPAAPYALVVHEDLSAQHAHGSAKFLERPMLSALPNLVENLKARL